MEPVQDAKDAHQERRRALHVPLVGGATVPEREGRVGVNRVGDLAQREAVLRASASSAIISPAPSPRIVAPRIRPVWGVVSTCTQPSVARSATARSIFVKGKRYTRYLVPARSRSARRAPTCASSGSVKVTHGTPARSIFDGNPMIALVMATFAMCSAMCVNCSSPVTSPHA